MMASSKKEFLFETKIPHPWRSPNCQALSVRVTYIYIYICMYVYIYIYHHPKKVTFAELPNSPYATELRLLESKRVRWWLPLCPWEEWDWPTSTTMPFFCIRRSMCKKNLIFAGDFCLSLEKNTQTSRDREMKDKSGPLPPKNPTAGTWNWWLPIFSPLPSFPGKPCFVFPVVHPKNFGESLLDWKIVRRLFSRWGLQILSRKAGQRWKMMTEDASFVCVPPQKRLSEKTLEMLEMRFLGSGVEAKFSIFWGFSQVTASKLSRTEEPEEQDEVCRFNDHVFQNQDTSSISSGGFFKDPLNIRDISMFESPVGRCFSVHFSETFLIKSLHWNYQDFIEKSSWHGFKESCWNR